MRSMVIGGRWLAMGTYVIYSCDPQLAGALWQLLVIMETTSAGMVVDPAEGFDHATSLETAG